MKKFLVCLFTLVSVSSFASENCEALKKAGLAETDRLVELLDSVTGQEEYKKLLKKITRVESINSQIEEYCSIK